MNLKNIFKSYFALTILLSVPMIADQGCNTCSTSCDCYKLCDNEEACPILCNSDGDVFGKTYYTPRSQGNNSARTIMGIQDKIHVYGSRDFYGVASLALEYQQAFHNLSGIGKWYTSNGLSNMTYGLIDDTTLNGDFDINSFNFGVTGSGEISFCPSKKDFIVDLNFYLGLDRWLCGSWLQVDIPLAWTSWDLGLKETLFAQGGSSIGGYDVPFANSDTPMTGALFGGTASGFADIQPLNKGRIKCRQSDVNLAGLRIDIGYDWIRRPNWHISSSWDFILPLGTKPSATYLFQPLVGDSQRAQFGGAWNAMYQWFNCDDTRVISLCFDGTLNTVLARKMERLMGLKIRNATLQEQAWSQYLLLKKFTKSGSTFTRDLVVERAANLLAGNVEVRADVLIDASLMLQYDRECWFGAIGYNLWYRSEEKIDRSCISIPDYTYAEMGIQYGDENLNLIDPNATINFVNYNTGDGIEPSNNTFISNRNIDYSRALMPSVFSNKLFGCVGYNWKECCTEPFVLVAGEIEFAQDNRTFSQWGIILKGGITY